MDFASQLANLQKTASRCASSSNDNNDNDSHPSKRRRYDSNNHYRRNNHHHRGGGRGGRGRYHGGGGRHHHGGGGRPHHRSRNDDDELHRQIENLSSYLSTQPTKPPPATPDEQQQQQPHHLVILFLTIDNLPHVDIWKKWCSSCSSPTMTVSAICHAKFPERVTDDFLKRRLLRSPARDGRGEERPLSYRPEWGSVEITRGMIDLLAEGLRMGREEDVDEEDGGVIEEKGRRFLWRTPPSAKSSDDDDDNDGENNGGDRIPIATRFLFASESCLPIQPLSTIETALFSTHPHHSWLKAMNKPNNGHARQLQWDRIHHAIPRERIWKADQWIVLTRAHARNVIVDVPAGLRAASKSAARREIWRCFETCKASDEMYFPTCLALLGVELEERAGKKESSSKSMVRNQRVTYSDWSMGAKSPVTFETLRELKDAVEKAREEGCLFARKFAATGRKDGIDVDGWVKVVLGRDFDNK